LCKEGLKSGKLKVNMLKAAHDDDVLDPES